MKVIAIIPARGGSKSIPRKNLAPLAGKPLLTYSIEVARRCRRIQRTIVSTDDEEIRRVAQQSGAETPFLRPAELARDDTPDLPVFAHALDWLREEEGFEPDLVVHLRPTTPLRRPETVDAAIRLLEETPKADAVRCVSAPLQNPFKMWRPNGTFLKPLVELGVPEPYNQPRQRLPEVLWQNGYVDVTRTATIHQKKSMTGDHIMPFVLDQKFVLDIDEPFSLELGAFLLAAGKY